MEVCKLPWLVWEKPKWLLQSLCSLSLWYNGLAQYEMQLPDPGIGYYPIQDIGCSKARNHPLCFILFARY